MRVTARINEQKEQKDGSCAIRIEISHNGRERHPTGISVKPGLWDAHRGRVKQGHPRHAVYNAAIKGLVDRIEALCLQNPTCSAKEIRMMLMRPDSGGRLVDALSQLPASSNPETARINALVLSNVEEAMPYTMLRDLDQASVRRFRAHLEAQGLHQNTVRMRMLRLRALVNTATGTESAAFRKVVPEELPSDTGSLTPAEAVALWRAPMPTELVALVRDVWMLQLFLAGMRIGDVITVGPSCIQGGLFVHQQTKTKLIRKVPLIGPARELIAKHSAGSRIVPIMDRAQSESSARAFVSKYLKVAAQAAGIDKPVASHWARHTFANWMAEIGVREDVIGALMGHRAKGRTAGYMAKQGDERSREAMRAFEASIADVESTNPQG